MPAHSITAAGLNPGETVPLFVPQNHGWGATSSRRSNNGFGLGSSAGNHRIEVVFFREADRELLESGDGRIQSRVQKQASGTKVDYPYNSYSICYVLTRNQHLENAGTNKRDSKVTLTRSKIRCKTERIKERENLGQREGGLPRLAPVPGTGQ